MTASISRRTLLASSAAVAILGVPQLTACTTFNDRAPIDTVGKVDFLTPLPIPPIAESTVANGIRTFALEAKTGTSEFIAGKSTPTWGYNGAFLGPTLRATTGETVRVKVANNLPEATTVHWHGMKLPAAMDGGPHQTIHPGDSWTAEWTVEQPSATVWYHPHPHGQTEAHVQHGLAGLFILDDTDDPAELPHEYGVDDIPVVLQDRSFESNGTFATPDRAVSGLVGDTILVNGAIGPVLTVASERTRLRILNGSSARVYNLGWSNDQDITVIATDSGLLRKPQTTDRVLLSPGERVEILFDGSAGETVILRSHPQDLRMGKAMSDGAGANDTLDLLQVVAAATLTPAVPLPLTLIEDNLFASIASATIQESRRFELSGTLINGKAMDMKRIDHVLAAGAYETWMVRNIHSQVHNFHVHNARFRILSIENAEPPAYLQGWKDTVLLPAGQTANLAVTFGDYTDPDLPYMYHCHLLWHEDQGMMGQYTIVDRKDVDDAPRSINVDAGMQH
ncbi:multicopper oxidase family protein [Lysinibacter cavernae]|uniref:Bilirubin oxidase n=1 Tax=Lysinibacter cavernae TaxID=1640652 RepID=A0A7X5R038_9MICO|nr:multicopper oxidase domain-containing protein [Lysinibacter cavernae]NIH53126.1 bilirubin oxidase [Lysinibacter cavernae]